MTRANLTAPIIRLLTWVRANPGRQKAEIPDSHNLRTAEKMQLVWWRGPKGWVLTDEGKRQLAINTETTT